MYSLSTNICLYFLFTVYSIPIFKQGFVYIYSQIYNASVLYLYIIYNIDWLASRCCFWLLYYNNVFQEINSFHSAQFKSHPLLFTRALIHAPPRGPTTDIICTCISVHIFYNNFIVHNARDNKLVVVYSYIRRHKGWFFTRSTAVLYGMQRLFLWRFTRAVFFVWLILILHRWRESCVQNTQLSYMRHVILECTRYSTVWRL